MNDPRTTLARLLTLSVDLRDADACAEITPEQAAAYLTGKGWEAAKRRANFTEWQKDVRFVAVPSDTTFADYGRRLCEVVAACAAEEQRSPLAVWLDMKAAPLVTETPPLLARVAEVDGTAKGGE